MATSVITGKVVDAAGLPVSAVPVVARLRPAGFRRTDYAEIIDTPATTDASGNWSLTLERTADIEPDGTYYEIEVRAPASAGGGKQWAVTIGPGAATLFASLLVGPPPGGDVINFLTQAQGDARYTLASNALAFNVKDHGAAGDGVTVDTADIQGAIDLANAAGGGIAYFPAGTYLTGTLTLPDNVHLVGAGMRATVLKANGNVPVVQTQNFATLTGTNGTGGVKNFSIRDLTIDGNKASFATSIGLRVYGYGYVLDRIRIANCGGDGFYSEWSTSAGSPGTDSMEAQIVNCKFHDNGGQGVNFKGPHDTQWLNCVSYLNGAIGFWVQVGGNSQFTNCHSWGNSQTHGWRLDDTCYLSNCEGEGASVDQLWIRANDCSVVGGNWFGAGAATPVGIQLGDSGLTVAGTQIKTKIENCTSGAFKLTGEVNSILEALVYQTSGTVFATNNPAAGTNYQINVAGMAWTAPAASFFSGVQLGRGAAAGSVLWSGSSAPAVGLGSNGDFYLRTDTPGTVNQRLYVKAAGAWSGIL